MNRYFELIDPSRNHAKFWEIIVDGTTVNVHYGRIGTIGQTQVKTFPSASAADRHIDKLIQEKRGKGYVEKTPPDGKKFAQAPLSKPTLPIPTTPPMSASPPKSAAPLGLRSRMRVSRVKRRENDE